MTLLQQDQNIPKPVLAAVTDTASNHSSTHQSLLWTNSTFAFPFLCSFPGCSAHFPSLWELQSQITLQLGRGCSYLPGGWSTYTQGSQPEKGVLKKHLNNHKPQRSFILFCSLPALEELFPLPLQLWLWAHHSATSTGESSPRNCSDFPLCQYRACGTIWRAKPGAWWGLRTNLVSFLASSLIQERQHELVAGTTASPLGQGQGCAPSPSKPFQAQQTLKHIKKWQPKAGNAG